MGKLVVSMVFRLAQLGTVSATVLRATVVRTARPQTPVPWVRMVIRVKMEKPLAQQDLAVVPVTQATAVTTVRLHTHAR